MTRCYILNGYTLSLSLNCFILHVLQNACLQNGIEWDALGRGYWSSFLLYSQDGVNLIN